MIYAFPISELDTQHLSDNVRDLRARVFPLIKNAATVLLRINGTGTLHINLPFMQEDLKV